MVSNNPKQSFGIGKELTFRCICWLCSFSFCDWTLSLIRSTCLWTVCWNCLLRCISSKLNPDVLCWDSVISGNRILQKKEAKYIEKGKPIDSERSWRSSDRDLICSTRSSYSPWTSSESPVESKPFHRSYVSVRWATPFWISLVKNENTRVGNVIKKRHTFLCDNMDLTMC